MLVAAQVRLYRDGLADLLRRDGRIQVVGTAAASGEAVAKIAETTPDVVIVDTSSRGSLELIRAITTRRAQARVVAIAVADHETEVIACAEAGAAGFVTRDAGVADLVEAVERAVSGEIVCSPHMASSLFRRIASLASERVPAPAHGRLTSREREIAVLVEEGLSNKQIARRLHIEVPTVKNHVHHILEKLNVTRRADAAALLRTDREL